MIIIIVIGYTKGRITIISLDNYHNNNDNYHSYYKHFKIRLIINLII